MQCGVKPVGHGERVYYGGMVVVGRWVGRGSALQETPVPWPGEGLCPHGCVPPVLCHPSSVGCAICAHRLPASPPAPRSQRCFGTGIFPPCLAAAGCGWGLPAAAGTQRFCPVGPRAPPSSRGPRDALMQGFPLSRPAAPCCLCPPSSQTLCGGSLSLPQHHRPRDGGSIPCQPPALGVPQNPSAPVPYRNGDGQWSSSLDPLPKMKRRQHLLCLLITNGGGETEGGGSGKEQHCTSVGAPTPQHPQSEPITGGTGDALWGSGVWEPCALGKGL